MRNLWKSAVAIVAISASLSTGLAGGSAVKAHDAGVAPVAPMTIYGLQSKAPCNPSVAQIEHLTPANPYDQTVWCFGYRFSWPSSDVATNPSSTKYQVQWFFGGGAQILGFTCGDPSSDFFQGGLNATPTKEYMMFSSAMSTNQDLTTCDSTWFDWSGGGGGFTGFKSAVTPMLVTAVSSGGSSTPSTVTWLSTSNSPTVSAVTVQSKPSSVVTTWAGLSGDTTEVIANGFYDVVASPPSGSSVTCRTKALSCTLTGLNPSTPYLVTVSTETNVGPANPIGPSYSIYPVAATKLAVKAIPVAFNQNVYALAYGIAPGSIVKIGIPGQKTSCTANELGQCTVELSATKTGSWTILAQSGTQTAIASAWYPAVHVTVGVHHGKPFTVNIINAPPKAPVVLTLSDGRTIRATTSTAGGVVVKVNTTKAAFLSVAVSISGTAFGSYDVQVS